MDSNDLFSFLDDASAHNVEENNSDEEGMVLDEPAVPSSNHKRKAVSPPEAAARIPSKTFQSDASMQDVDNQPGPSVIKKPRIGSPQPVVLDDFETEAKREVEASAGLTGAVVEGSRLELRHQVCTFHVPLPSFC